MNINENENILYSDRETEEKKKNKGNRMFVSLVVCFCLIIGGVSILNFIVPDGEFSESENRVLASMPRLTLSAIVDGSFMKSYETYLSDQFVFRDKIISVKTFFDRLSGLKEENGVYISKQGYLIEKQTAYSTKKVKAITKSMNEFFKKNPYSAKAVLLSPNSSCIYSDKLPSFVEVHDQQRQLKAIKNKLKGENLTFINIRKTLLESKDETQLFYRTDHHWTTRGAYEAFKVLAKKWELDTEKVKYQFLTVSTDFEGTLASKTGIHSVKDRIEVCVPQNSKGTYVVTYESEERQTATLFDDSKLRNKNQYELFLGGNYDKVIIDTVSESRASLLIVKDSYANCMIPMLTPYFAKIVVVDPRYMTDTIDTVMEENNFSHILFLYNLNTFLEDSSIVNALGQ